MDATTTHAKTSGGLESQEGERRAKKRERHSTNRCTNKNEKKKNKIKKIMR